ncbi:MAG: SLBB domain-containing protein [Alistipes sp.]|nr:SLBB domain-containing protein [Candidatus Minthomonas equi]
MVFTAIPVYGQSASEIAAAKSMARAYGYSDSEINAMLNNRNGQNGGKSAKGSGGNTAGSFQTENDVNSNQSYDLQNLNMTILETMEQEEDKNKNKDKDKEKEKANEIYGHSYFTSTGLSIIPSYNAPAPASYVLGPGDELVIDIWGATVSHVEAVMGNDGSIPVPDLGPVYLAGMTLSKAENYLQEQLGRIYSGLTGSNPDTYIKLSIRKIKGVSIYVSGEVVTPGLYSVPSLATTPSVIYMAGGISEKGSVRNITLFRHGRKVADFDMYDFLFNGRFNENLRIQDGDVIAVAAYSDVVKVDGAVMRPMNYEITEGETVKDVIKYAAGFAQDAQRNSVNVYRRGIAGNTSIDVPEPDFASFRLQDGDCVSVRTYKAMDQNTVSIYGPVKYPGAYALNDNIIDLASLLEKAGGLIDGAYTGKGQISRKDANRQPEFLIFDLAKVMNGSLKITLKREDIITLYSHDDMSEARFVSINGAVENPAVYSYSDTLTIARLIKGAGGLTENAYIASGQISREGSDGHPVIVPFDVQKAMNDSLEFKVLPGDAVRIYSIKEIRKNTTVSINGEVNAPGEYVYRDGMTLVELVELAQGCTHGVDLTNVEISTRGGRERGSVRTVNLEENAALWQEELNPYDMVSFRRLTFFNPQTAVTVDGEVIAPGTYVISKAQVRLSDVMERVGGFTDDAYPHGAKLTRVLTEEEQERQKVAMEIAASKLSGSVKVDSIMLEDRYNIGIDLEKAMSFPGSVADVILRAGDIIEIPQMNNTVKISGGVNYPNTVAFDDRQPWSYYVSQAGGYTKRARKGQIYAVYMSGQVARREKIKPEPGMELVVPERDPSQDRQMTPAEIASLASSTTSIASMVVALLNAFK